MYNQSVINVTLGTDPEIFVVDGDTPIPGFYALGMEGVKDIPLPHGDLTSDGCAVEFTQTPRSNPLDLVNDMRENLQSIQHIVTSKAVDMFGRKIHASLLDSPTVTVPWDYIRSLSSENLRSVHGLPTELMPKYALDLFGCSPDFSVYTEKTMCRPDPRQTQLRTSGGHIHFGLGKYIHNVELVQYITAALDMTLGCLSVYVLSDVPEAKQRTSLYGEPGNIRVNHTRETLEYRVLPAIMLLHSPALSGLCFALGKVVVEAIVSLWEKYGEDFVDDCIGSSERIDYMLQAMSSFDMYSASDIVSDLARDLQSVGYSLPLDVLRSHGWRCSSLTPISHRARLSEYPRTDIQSIANMPVHQFSADVVPGNFILNWR